MAALGTLVVDTPSSTPEAAVQITWYEIRTNKVFYRQLWPVHGQRWPVGNSTFAQTS